MTSGIIEIDVYGMTTEEAIKAILRKVPETVFTAERAIPRFKYVKRMLCSKE